MAKTDDIVKALKDEGHRPENKDNRVNRKERVPFGTPRGKLEVRAKDKEPGFFYAWVNEDKTDARLEEGFEFVTHSVQVGHRNVSAARRDDGSMSVCVPVGPNQKAYLMRMPQDWYDEDMAKHQKEFVDAKEETMRRTVNSNGLQGSLDISRKS